MNFRSVSTYLLMVACLGLLTTNIYLQRKVSSLYQQINGLQGPEIGTRFTTVSGLDLANLPSRIDYGKSKQRSLFLALSPSCRYTKENWHYWNQLLADAKGTPVVFADLTGDVDGQYFKDVGLPAPEKVLKLTSEMKSKYNLTRTPTTVVLGAQGNVEGVWVGLLDDKKVRDISASLKAHE